LGLWMLFVIPDFLSLPTRAKRGCR
jgi:hypothetical protein